MAPAHLLGRYLSLYSLTFSGSLALGPAIGGLLLQTNPDPIWWAACWLRCWPEPACFNSATAYPTPLHQARSTLAPAPQSEPA